MNYILKEEEVASTRARCAESAGRGGCFHLRTGSGLLYLWKGGSVSPPFIEKGDRGAEGGRGKDSPSLNTRTGGQNKGFE